MKKLPGWLTYAAKINSKINRLPNGQRSSETRERVILDSHLTAKHKHQYPGTLIDWDYIVANLERRHRVSKGQMRNGRSQK
jgi:hypothetical protein